MGKFRLNKLLPVGIGLLTFAGFVGSISGSLAWWAYSTRVSAAYQGTSVTTSEQLQIGLRISKTNPKAEDIVTALASYGVTEDTHIDSPSYRYVFSKAGGGLPAEAIKKYLSTEGVYAIDELAAISSRTYTEGQALTLYESLIFGNQDNITVADTSKYVRIPFVFRILKLNAAGSADDFAPNRKIYLSKVVADASDSTGGESTVQNALRVHFNNGNEAERFMISVGDNTAWDPDGNWTDEQKTAAINNMYTPVSGVLDLNNDGYYDSANGTEILYGPHTGTGSATEQATAPTMMDDVNGMYADMPDGEEKNAILGDLANASTFLSRHEQGNNCYYNYDGLTLGKAYYRTVNSIKPNDSQAILTGGRVLCTTANSGGNYLAELETTIWLEGWDHAVVDKAITHKFSLGLQFQIDLVS